MNQVYDWERRGTNVYEMLLHRLGLEVAECIKTRMEVVRAQIGKVVQEKGRTARRASSASAAVRRARSSFPRQSARARRHAPNSR